MTSPGITLVYLVAAFVAGVSGGITWRYRGARGARPLAGMLLAASVWALLDAVELQTGTVAAKRLVSQLQYVAVVAVAPLFLRAALGLSRMGERWKGPVARLAVWGVPVLTVAVAWTSRWHGWLWRDIAIPDPTTNLAVYGYGPWFWLFTAHAYLLLAAGTVILLSTVGQVRRPFRAPLLAVLAAVLLPWIGNVAYILKLGPWAGLNWLSVSLVASGALLAWGALHGGLFDLLPRAREMLVSGLADAVVVLDGSGRVAFANPAAERIVGPAGSRIARSSGLLGPRERGGDEEDGEHGEGAEGDAGTWDGGTPAGLRDWRREVAVEVKGRSRWFDVRSRPVHDRWGEPAGQLLVLRDLTERKKLERAREELIEELESALERVHTLEGLLPICAGCRKIRDDAGFWQRIEKYLGERMPVRFSHALCPECEEELYPELAEEAPAEPTPTGTDPLDRAPDEPSSTEPRSDPEGAGSE